MFGGVGDGVAFWAKTTPLPESKTPIATTTTNKSFKRILMTPIDVRNGGRFKTRF